MVVGNAVWDALRVLGRKARAASSYGQMEEAIADSDAYLVLSETLGDGLEPVLRLLEALGAVLGWLVHARARQRAARGFTQPFAEAAYKALAHAMTAHPDGKRATVETDWAALQLTEPFHDEHQPPLVDGHRIAARGARFWGDELLDGGVVVQEGPGELRFWHLTFQEHLAARHILETHTDPWPALNPHVGDPQWAEVFEHIVGRMAHDKRHAPRGLLAKLIERGDSDDLSLAAGAVGTLGRLLPVLNAHAFALPDGSR